MGAGKKKTISLSEREKRKRRMKYARSFRWINNKTKQNNGNNNKE
jgi:hypothetical protein